MKPTPYFLDQKNRRSKWLDFADGFSNAFEVPTLDFDFEPDTTLFSVEPLKPVKLPQPSFNTAMGNVLQRFYQFVGKRVKARDEQAII